jgi:MYXO-CTERM domain-containing protein
MRFAVATMLLVAVLIPTLAPGPARADGDPASDVLLGESVFYPYSPAVSAGLQKRLNAEAAAASRAHFPVKVALIARPADLGAITVLFGKPQQYAAFLDQEISFLDVKPLLLVVMPNGYGVQHLGPSATRAAATLKKPAGATTDDLARAAILAVPKLAAAAGHPIGSVSSGSGSGGPSPPLAAGVLAAAAIAGAAVVRRRRGTGSRYRRGRSGRSG